MVACLVPIRSCEPTHLLPPAQACSHPCSSLGGPESAFFVGKITDARRCPCAAVPKNALAIDGGASSDAGDAISWLKGQGGWNVLAYEPLPRNCEQARAALAKFSGRGQVRCSALSKSTRVTEFVDESGLGNAWGSLAALSNTGGGLAKLGSASHVASGARHVVRVNVTTLDLDVKAARKASSADGVYLLKRAQSAESHLVEPSPLDAQSDRCVAVHS